MKDSIRDVDILLVKEAQKIIETRYKEGNHHIGAALRTKSGKIFSAVHLEANIGRIAVCAEAIAIGMAAAAEDTEIDTIVAVNRNGDVVSPCGMCRELISDYSPEAWVIIPGDEGKYKSRVLDLLPNNYLRVQH